MSLIGANTQLGENVKIEKSTVGNNCVIESGVTITGCTIMDGVTVREGVNLTDCLISDKVVVGKGSQLKLCLVESKFSVEEKSKLLICISCTGLIFCLCFSTSRVQSVFQPFNDNRRVINSCLQINWIGFLITNAGIFSRGILPKFVKQILFTIYKSNVMQRYI